MIRCPHSLQRMGSRGLISFLTPQSSTTVRRQIFDSNTEKLTCTDVFHLLSRRHVWYCTLAARGAILTALLLTHGRENILYAIVWLSQAANKSIASKSQASKVHIQHTFASDMESSAIIHLMFHSSPSSDTDAAAALRTKPHRLADDIVN